MRTLVLHMMELHLKAGTATLHQLTKKVHSDTTRRNILLTDLSQNSVTLTLSP